jgi:hypothetical protein
VRLITSTAARVARHTDHQINDRILRQTEASIAYYREHPQQIPRRLAELDQEWAIERALETGSSGLTLLGLVLAIGVSRKWLLLSLAVQGFFMQHAIQGWCPPLPALRRLGVRTADEINQERHALWDFQHSRPIRGGGQARRSPRATPTGDGHGERRRRADLERH